RATGARSLRRCPCRGRAVAAPAPRAKAAARKCCGIPAALGGSAARPASRSPAARPGLRPAVARPAGAKCRSSCRTRVRARETRRRRPCARTRACRRRSSRDYGVRSAAAGASCTKSKSAAPADAASRRAPAKSCRRPTALRSRTACRACRSSSLDVLDLLAHLLDRDLHVDRGARRLAVLRLGGQRVRLAIQLLHQEIEPATRGLGGIEHRGDFVEVGAETVELLVDVHLVG